jgi:hypothetical protein
MEFYSEASHFAPGKPARNNLVFYSHRAYKTLFIIRFHRGSLDVFCSAVGSSGSGSDLALASLQVDVAHLTQLTLSSAHPHDWLGFFRHPDAWPRFRRALPVLTMVRLRITQSI